ncbi:hypothetical protein ACIRPX_04000 [Streptomyces sp. NPDC101225]|uniref:hypothetical protein n=1 Tax=Streptomyces sp. NPDC101225 TaxID=3366135 RepID=UPI00382605E9
MTGSGRQEATALDLLGAQRRAGPCWESYVSGTPVRPVSVRAAHRKVRRPGSLLGALNVFVRTAPDGAAAAGRAEPAVVLAVSRAPWTTANCGTRRRVAPEGSRKTLNHQRI